MIHAGWQDAETVRQLPKRVYLLFVWSISCIWFLLFVELVWFEERKKPNEPANQRNQSDQMNQINQINQTNRASLAYPQSFSAAC